MWVVQEICLSAKEPIFLAGLFHTELDHLHQFWKTWARAYDSIEVLEYLQAMQIKNTIDIRYQLAQDGGPPDITLAAKDLLEILRKMTDQKCTSPHDYIYAILGLIHRASLLDYLVPNYRLPYQRVFEQYAKFVFTITGDLSLLDTVADRLKGVPSWMPDFRTLKYSDRPKTIGIISCPLDNRLSVQG
jgi:hypothetical protein